VNDDLNGRQSRAATEPQRDPFLFRKKEKSEIIFARKTRPFFAPPPKK